MQLTARMARAYGAPAGNRAAPAGGGQGGVQGAGPVNKAAAPSTVERATALQAADRVTLTSTAPVGAIKPANAASTITKPQAIANMQRVVAGRVNEAMDFDKAAPTMPTLKTNEVLPMYNRAADRIEAATGIQLGRSIDVSG